MLNSPIYLWMNQPSHHQSDFFQQVHIRNPAFSVIYYGKPSQARIIEGWTIGEATQNLEKFVAPLINSLDTIPYWRSSIHVVPGYGCNFLRQLTKSLTQNNVSWIHWSEKASPGLRWWASYPLKRAHAKRVNRHALGALAIGATASDDFVRWGITRNKIAHLPYSISGIEWRTPDQGIADFSAGRRVFLYVGSLYHGKGVDLLIDAFAQIASMSPEWCLVLVGNDRTNGQYARQANRLGIAERVLFRGVIPSTDIGSAFSAADVLVLPSRYDGWGMVVNEAAAMGLPLVVSDAAGAAWHMVDHAVNGFRFTSGSVRALHQAMSAYVGAPELLAMHGEASKRIFASQSSDVMAERFLAILQTWQATRA